VKQWAAFATALGFPVSMAQLHDVMTGSSSEFLLQTGIEQDHPVVRLLDQGLVDQLLHERPTRDDQSALLEALLASIPVRTGWNGADGYLLRHAVEHAELAGRLAQLLSETDYFIHAELPAVNAAAARLSDQDRPPEAWVILRAGAAAADLAASDRAGLLAVTAAHLGQLDTAARFDSHATFARSVWAHPLDTDATMLSGHIGSVWALTSVRLPDGRHLLATGGSDDSLIW
jgi:hypothetical protein